ncbi:hypothetical protein PROFUN_11378 [Planoprotostelium fungivorum]|uniref:Uncharacterized protein n=1 Tax=Planoprotostelium fungivorum TaxID=1890364 RepID=A0A2P6N302_9EUKA|nr:hypothetical protein PROFUN_11378 [Planoprotostelium fungivorum]
MAFPGTHLKRFRFLEGGSLPNGNSQLRDHSTYRSNIRRSSPQSTRYGVRNPTGCRAHVHILTCHAHTVQRSLLLIDMTVKRISDTHVEGQHPIIRFIHTIEIYYGFIISILYNAVRHVFHLLGLGQGPREDHPCSRSAVLITGASAGIGRATALSLARAGFHVLAGVRKDESGEDLIREYRERGGCVGDIIPVVMDVTNKREIECAYQQVGGICRSKDIKLVGLVNNAGHCTMGGFEVTSKDDIDHQMQMGFFSYIDVVKTFIPLIKANRGRLIFITSVGSFAVVPGFSIYCAAKGAMRNLTFALRMELNRFGVGVTSIEPGFINSDGIHDGVFVAMEKFKEDFSATGIKSMGGVAHGDAGEWSFYVDHISQEYRHLVSEDWNRMIEIERKIGTPPRNVAAAVVTAMKTPYMRSSYLVGWDARVQSVMQTYLPQDFLEWLNVKMFPFCAQVK